MDIRLYLLIFVFLQTTYTDIRSHLIKNYITFPLMMIGFLYHLIYGEGFWFSITGLMISFVMTLIISIIIPSLGMGDMKLMMGLGSLMGFRYAVMTYFYALLLFIMFYGWRGDLWKEIKHAYLTLIQALETKKPVEKELVKNGKALAPFIGIAGIAMYFFDFLYII